MNVALLFLMFGLIINGLLHARSLHKISDQDNYFVIYIIYTSLSFLGALIILIQLIMILNKTS
jgi:ascorbate-specific PTS system EIIC-type component UlaA